MKTFHTVWVIKGSGINLEGAFSCENRAKKLIVELEKEGKTVHAFPIELTLEEIRYGLEMGNLEAA
jgi:hypothetical protein